MGIRFQGSDFAGISLNSLWFYMYCESIIPVSLLAIASYHFGFPADASLEPPAVAAAPGIMTMSIAAIQLFMAFSWKSTVSVYPQHMLRPLADSGSIWGGLLVPLTTFAMNTISNELNQTDGLDAYTAWLISVAMSWSFTFLLLSKYWLILGYTGLFILGYMSSQLQKILLVVAAGGQHIALQKIVQWLPRSFTIGEAAVISQGIVLVAIDLAFRRPPLSGARAMYTLVLEATGLCLLLTIVILRQNYFMSNGKSLCILIGAPIFGTALLVAIIARVNIITWAIVAVFGKPINYLILGYWAILLAGGLVIYNYYKQSTSSKLILHLKRKAYHILAVLLFAPGFTAPLLLHLGFTVALVIFVWVEAIRVLDIEPWASPINQFMCQFTDARDAGQIITSHFYLLFGCALPVWVGSSSAVACLAGVLALGIADTAASLIGIRYGTQKWPATSKTIEGTVAFVVSLFASVELAHIVFPSNEGALQSFIMCVVLGLLEALTEQNDNLIVPLTMYSVATLLNNSDG